MDPPPVLLPMAPTGDGPTSGPTPVAPRGDGPTSGFVPHGAWGVVSPPRPFPGLSEGPRVPAGCGGQGCRVPRPASAPRRPAATRCRRWPSSPSSIQATTSSTVSGSGGTPLPAPTLLVTPPGWHAPQPELVPLFSQTFSRPSWVPATRRTWPSVSSPGSSVTTPTATSCWWTAGGLPSASTAAIRHPGAAPPSRGTPSLGEGRGGWLLGWGDTTTEG